MATAHQIRDLITETTTGIVRPRVPREVREEVCRYAARRRERGAPWAVIARETGLDIRKLQRWNTRARRAASQIATTLDVSKSMAAKLVREAAA